jgi:hypothetical protein
MCEALCGASRGPTAGLPPASLPLCHPGAPCVTGRDGHRAHGSPGHGVTGSSGALRRAYWPIWPIVVQSPLGPPRPPGPLCPSCPIVVSWAPPGGPTGVYGGAGRKIEAQNSAILGFCAMVGGGRKKLGEKIPPRSARCDRIRYNCFTSHLTRAMHSCTLTVFTAVSTISLASVGASLTIRSKVIL